MSAGEGRSLLESVGVRVERDPKTPWPRYATAKQCRVFEVGFADHYTAAQDMARELLTPPAQPAFPGGVIWLYQWGNGWSEIAEHTLNRFLKSYGIESGYRDTPVIAVDANEAKDAVALLGLMMTYDCDCFFVAADASYMVLSCDEMILTLVTASDREYQWYQPIVDALKFKELRGNRNPFCPVPH